MIISSQIVRTQPGKYEEVVLELKKLPNIRVYGKYRNNNIIAVFESENEDKLSDLLRYLTNEYEEISGIVPFYFNG